MFAPLSVATCSDPIPPMKGSIGGYTSTVEGSVVAFHRNEGLIPAEQMTTTCTSNGSWSPNPAELIYNEPPSDGEGQLSVGSHRTISNHFILLPQEMIYTYIYNCSHSREFHVAWFSFSLPEATVGSAITCAVQLSKRIQAIEVKHQFPTTIVAST